MGEGLRRQDWRFLGWCLLLTLACGAVAWQGFGRAFPEASIDFQVNRQTSRDRAMAFLDSLGHDVSGWKHAAIFTYDNEAKVFLERELGAAPASGILSDPVRLWRWRHRWFRPQKKEEFRVDVTPSGGIARFEHLLPEEAPGDSLTPQQARGAAEEFLRSRSLLQPGDLDFIEASSARRPGRVDHTFLWKQSDFDVGGGTVRWRVQVAGNRVSLFEASLEVPDSWSHGYRLLRAQNETANAVAAVLLVLTGLAMLVVLVLRVRDRDVRWHTAAAFGAVAFALQLLATLNSFDLERFFYPTEDRYSSFLVWQLVRALLSAFAASGLVFLLTASAEPVYRERYPGKLSLSRTFSWPGLGTRDFLRQMHLGVALAFVFVAYQTLFYLLAERWGAWAPLDVPYSNMLNTAFPWALVLLGGFFPAVSEEFVSRMFTIPFLSGLLSRGFLGRRPWGRNATPWIAVVISAGIWGFAHAGYPNQPFYIRGVEVGLAGVAVGWIMLRWGILATLVWHYSIDACYTALLLLRSGDSYLVWSGSMAAGVMLLPLVLAWARYALRGGFVAREGLRNADEPGPPEVAAPPPESPAPAWVSPRVSRARLGVGAAVAALLLSLRLVPAERPGAGQVLQVEREEARSRARAWGRELGLDTEDFEEAVALMSRFDAPTGRYVLQRTELAQLNELYRGPLHTPVWLVRAYRPGDLEEIRFLIPAAGRRAGGGSEGAGGERAAGADRLDPTQADGLAGLLHVLADSVPGARLHADSARSMAEAFLRRQGQSPERWRLIESSSTEKDARRDHAFEWEDPSQAIGDAMPRTTVTVQGERIGGLLQRMHLPEAWERADRERKPLPRLAWVLARGMLGLALLLVVLVFLGEVRSRRFPWRLALSWGAVAGSLSLVPIALGWEARVARDYPAATPWELFRVVALSAAGLRFVLYGLVVAMLVGTVLAVRRSAVTLADGRWSRASRRDGLVLAGLGIATWAGLRHVVDLVRLHAPGPPRVRELFMIAEADSTWPWLQAYTELLQNGLLLLPLLALMSHLARRTFGHPRFFTLWVLGLLLFAAGATRTTGEFVNTSLVVFLQACGVVWLSAYVLRNHDLAYVLSYVAGVGFVHAFTWMRQPLRSLQFSGLLLALLVGITVAFLAGRGRSEYSGDAQASRPSEIGKS